MTWAAVAIGGGAALGTGLASAFGGSDETVTQVPLETPEQRQARIGLLDFARTGSYGNYNAGEAYTGSLGDFGMSALETAGQGQVFSRLGEGQGDLFDMGGASLRDLLTTDKYNPLNQEGVYAGLSGAFDRTTREAGDALKRSSAFGGSLYSTDTVRGLGEVEARGAEKKSATLASLYDNYIARKMGAIPQAFGAAAQGEATTRGRISDAYQYGGLPRNLNTARDQAAYQEFQRQRRERQGQITALSNVAGQNANFGVPEVTIPGANPWLDAMNSLSQFGGSYYGAQAGRR